MSATASEADSLLAAAAALRLLSLGLARPSEESLERLARLAEALGEGELARAARGADVEEAAAEYEAVLASDGPCPPHEGDYLDDPFQRTRLLADLAGFYRAFGAEAGGPAGERPDHAGCELEFLSFLALRRRDCLEKGEAGQARVCAEAEEAFLVEHAGRWLPLFWATMEAAAGVPLYRALAASGGRLLQAELARRALRPRPLPRPRPRLRSGVEADEIACGDLCPAPLWAHGKPPS
jgi:TorA maturation chaperone TorD